jgi:hypothetical protein
VCKLRWGHFPLSRNCQLEPKIAQLNASRVSLARQMQDDWLSSSVFVDDGKAYIECTQKVSFSRSYEFENTTLQIVTDTIKTPPYE